MTRLELWRQMDAIVKAQGPSPRLDVRFEKADPKVVALPRKRLTEPRVLRLMANNK